MAEEHPVRFITPPNTLRAKVVEGGAGAVTPEILAKAEQVMAGMSDSYVAWAETDLERLSEIFEALKEAPRVEHKDLLRSLFLLAHNMKGQGGSFGYGLITTFGDLLCRYVEKLEAVTPAQLEVIALHMDAMQVVIGNRMKGDGGANGAKLLRGLELVAAKRAG